MKVIKKTVKEKNGNYFLIIKITTSNLWKIIEKKTVLPMRSKQILKLIQNDFYS